MNGCFEVLIGLQVGLIGFSEVKQSTEQKKRTDEKFDETNEWKEERKKQQQLIWV